MKLYVASAGTGKTHALVQELLARLREGVPLRRMAAITFTRKAAEELRERILEAVAALGDGEAKREAHGAVFTTIHGFMAEALRHTAPLLSLDPDFAVLDEFLAEGIFLEEVRSLLYLKGLPSDWEELLQKLYQKRSLAEAFSPAGEENRFLVTLYGEALSGYRKRLLEALGPGDLEALALRLVENPLALSRLVGRFPHLFVDEYQDVNPVQARFFQALEEAGARVVAVGDPKQSIYLFRNARVEVFRQALSRAERCELRESYRHAKAVAAFLNRFLDLFPKEERASLEPRRAEEGRVEVHWVVGEGSLEAKRAFEAHLLAERLKALHGEGVGFGEMAVLVRSRASLPFLERAFRAQGVPYVLRRGQSFFTRPEVRDLYHALRLSLLDGPPTPEEHLSLLAFLRGPFMGLDLGEVEEALEEEDPLPRLPEEARVRLDWLKGLANRRPLEALRTLAQEEGFLKRLPPRARANLDALLLLAARERFPDLEALLEWLKVRAQDPEAGELPEGGEGVQLLTVHAAKGLEWPVVAVFDLARGEPPDQEPLLVGEGGEVALRGTPGYLPLAKALRQAQREEARRLLYVALSRARDVLLLTGSLSGRPGPWAEALLALGLGPDGEDPLVHRHVLGPIPKAPLKRVEENPKPAPYAGWRLAPSPLPRVYSPSALRKEEPKPLAEALEGEAMPEHARALGTLVHYAIARNLDPRDRAVMEALLLQEVVFPFAEEEREALLAEVKGLLSRYHALLGGALPALADRAEDHPELPLVLPLEGTVWYGVLDRLYRVGDKWFLDDYKTDQKMRPEEYRFQLALYAEAVRRALGVEAEARLVYLRHGEVHAFSQEDLRKALKEDPPG
ncbi:MULTISPECIES: UvrD-helicase domain-containing protein [Thermus]|jgi:ATP-dependent exoDNAse (exonuclease V) beta subunit|uniref:DNA 3'-5' helicase n=1 Tax=Thermus brockianus TaxID=56956 RepID=A0A1J0LT01_THEBO|nr:UvrD-helicase domain-containing protein [Thermus brockianus]APD08843.1 ATP-dependent DNA helicase [Thermus brockianus]